MLLRRFYNLSSPVLMSADLQSMDSSLDSVDTLFHRLISSLSVYMPPEDLSFVRKAYAIAVDSHRGQKRASMEPYVIHPLQVALILVGLHADYPTICTALLHDTLEDTDITVDMLHQQFPDPVVAMIEGVTKLNQIRVHSFTDTQAENFRKFLLALSKDIRILLVKLADRLHNMRTIGHLAIEKQRRIALETLEVYTPLAERIGFFHFKDELENLSFSVLEPKIYESITRRVATLQETFGMEVDKTSLVLEDLLVRHDLSVQSFGRVKSPYSIWKKMQKRHVGFEHLSDIFAFRLIVPTVDDCYRALGIIHSTYHYVTGGFKDYISTPKQNGYQSLHTGVIGPNGARIEIQLRTQKMHDFSEHGVAAHWAYKQNINSLDAEHAYLHLKKLFSMAQSSDNAKELYAHTKMDMFSDVIFVFTPMGELFELPSHASALDFAYAVHTDIGHHATGAKVNGETVPLSRMLQSGDQVAILTSDSATPMLDSLSMVHTGYARNALMRFMRQQRQKDLIAIGQHTLQQVFTRSGYAFKESYLPYFLDYFKLDKPEDLYLDIATDVISVGNLQKTLVRYFPDSLFSGLMRRVRRFFHHSSSPFMVMDAHFHSTVISRATCCMPVPGDKIVGVFNADAGIDVHVRHCPFIVRSGSQRKSLGVDWYLGSDDFYTTHLFFESVNSVGIMAQVLDILSQHQVNLNRIVSLDNSTGHSQFYIDVDVQNTAHLDRALKHLRSHKQLITVRRTIASLEEGQRASYTTFGD